MKIQYNNKSPKFWALNLLIFLLFLGIFFKFPNFPHSGAHENEANLELKEIPQLAISQENTLICLSNPTNPEPKIVRKVKVIVTGYSSTIDQTDSTPFITASGKTVKDGIIANNLLPFGTRVKIPEIYGDKIFVVEDRMSYEKEKYFFDIWFPSYKEALNFGAKRTYIEVLES